MDDLTARERAALLFVVEYKRGHDGCAPSVREIMRGCGISSTSMTNRALSGLKKKGLIALRFDRARSIEVIGGRWEWSNVE